MSIWGHSPEEILKNSCSEINLVLSELINKIAELFVVCCLKTLITACYEWIAVLLKVFLMVCGSIVGDSLSHRGAFDVAVMVENNYHFSNAINHDVL